MLSFITLLIESDNIFDMPAAVYSGDDGNGNVFSAPEEDESNKDELIKKRFITGKWEGPRPNNHWYDPIVNFIRPEATGDLYQKHDSPNEKYVKFDDGTKLKYDLYNQDNVEDTKKLMSKVYHRSNMTPVVDPIDIGLGFGADKIFAKPIQHVGAGLLNRPMNYIEQSVASSVFMSPASSGSKKLQ